MMLSPASSNQLRMPHSASAALTPNGGQAEIRSLVDTEADIASMIDELSKFPAMLLLYVGPEDIDLSRHGTISILQIHVRPAGRNYLVVTRR